jgi:hypothetical protein
VLVFGEPPAETSVFALFAEGSTGLEDCRRACARGGPRASYDDRPKVLAPGLRNQAGLTKVTGLWFGSEGDVEFL